MKHNNGGTAFTFFLNLNFRLYSWELSTRVAGPVSLLLSHADGAVRTFAVEVLGAIAGSHVGYQAGPGQ